MSTTVKSAPIPPSRQREKPGQPLKWIGKNIKRVAHGIVAGREADQPGHADVVGVVPLDVLLAAQRVHHRCLEALPKKPAPSTGA